MSAVLCSYVPCGNRTKDPGGRCVHHRGLGTTGHRPSSLPTPVPAIAVNPEPAQVLYRDVFGVEYDVTPEGRPRLLVDLPENARALGLRKSDPLAKHSSSFEDVEHSGTFTNVKHYRFTSEYGGLLHRTDGPAVIEQESSYVSVGYGARVKETYYLDGVPARTDGGPNEVLRRADGSVYEERYLGTNSLVHREDGPAAITYFEDGTVIRSWKRRGKASRIDGATLEVTDPSGRTTPRPGAYALAGKRHSSAEDFYRALGELSVGTLRRHFTGTPLAELSRGREHEIVRILGAGVRTPEGVEEVLGGSPAEWVAAYEEGAR